MLAYVWLYIYSIGLSTCRTSRLPAVTGLLNTSLCIYFCVISADCITNKNILDCLQRRAIKSPTCTHIRPNTGAVGLGFLLMGVGTSHRAESN